MRKFIKYFSLAVALVAYLSISATVALAKVSLPAVFGSNMVLQQRTAAPIWGKATAGKTVKITVGWSKTVYSGIADNNGDWKVKVQTPAYGGPYKITISDGDPVVLTNVLIGDVWVCSGQSNMEMPLAGWGKINNYEQEIAAANYPKIRLLQADKVTSYTTKPDVKMQINWQECSPEYISTFSSTAYFFAREVYKKTGIPIGLIHTSWGGTIAEAWTSGTALKKMPDFANAVKQIEKTAVEGPGVPYAKRAQQWLAQTVEKDAGYRDGQFAWNLPSENTGNWPSMRLPAQWESAGLPDLDGIVWFRKVVSIPAAWTGKALTIELGPVDDNEMTWFNGVKIGETNGYATLRKYQVPASLVKEGENLIAVRVFDSGGGGGMYGEPSSMKISNGSETMSLAGEWRYKTGLDFKKIDPMPVDYNNPNQPTVLYNAMIYPFIQFAIKGAIWYQGESNADRAYQYQTLFPTMITDWRAKWGQGNFPFYFVQLASFMAPDAQPSPSSWAELRDAQKKTLSLPNTGMAVTIDIGDEKDIHPKNKQEVGRRLALLALSKTYGKQVIASGPTLSSFNITGASVILNFANAAGLRLKGLKGFAIAGADQKFYWADAVVKGSQVILSCSEVKKPVAIRYAWGNNPQGILFNSAGLPASPFRTDNWKGITQK